MIEIEGKSSELEHSNSCKHGGAYMYIYIYVISLCVLFFYRLCCVFVVCVPRILLGVRRVFVFFVFNVSFDLFIVSLLFVLLRILHFVSVCVVC